MTRPATALTDAPATPPALWVALAISLAVVMALEAQMQLRPPLGLPAGTTGNLLYVRSPEFAKRAALSFDALAADIYWIRTVQHYGRTKLQPGELKRYDLLYPLLDLTTSLDPSFDLAYRFGAVFLAEPYPAGPGRIDLAIALLEKGLRAQPRNWQMAQDIGFVHYWWRHDYTAAADWFTRAGEMPGAPNWLKPLAAVTLAQGGNRASSRMLWTQIMQNADAAWLRDQGRFRLGQLDAMDEITLLERAIEAYRVRFGARPGSWDDLIRAGVLRAAPVDPTEHMLHLDPASGRVTLAPDSPLNPLPDPDDPA